VTAQIKTEITTAAELEDVIGVPLPKVAAKARGVLDPIDVQWISRSPFILIATSGADGSCDVSPKGDPAGFVQVIDEHTIAVPERPGNRRADGYRNVLENPHVGLIFLVPPRNDTLRVNGRARLVRDAPYFDAMVVKGHRPILSLEVTVEEVYFHCAKAFMRSRLWKHELWDGDGLPSTAEIARRLIWNEEKSQAELDEYYGTSYAERLYREAR
jgi:uncharacterized protein